MSSCSRIGLGIVFVLAALTSLGAAAGGAIPKNVWLMYVLSGVFVLCALPCIPGRHTAITGRAIGAAGFATCIGYIVSEILSPHKGTGPGECNLANAIKCFTVWGIPSGYVMIYGVYPKWAGRIGEAFGKDPHENEKQQKRPEEDLPRPWR